ncbi:MAG TPA: hypothetical protein DDW65_04270, partial [Firmicutes bacterium]|nr:hypothetical protein [Bacillota bacterium]
YINLMLRQLPGWVNHATNVYGMTDAILAPPRTDGVGGGDAYHFLSGYPHLYVNGITDWLLIPIFEYWQCYGNSQVPIGQDVNINDVKTVLGLTDADVARINSDGYFDLEKDLLFPLLDKNMNFWLQFASERYYKDGNGVNHVNDGTTLSAAIAAGDTKAKYIFAPGYSPENAPSGGNVMAFNSTMDISAAKNSVYMAETVLKAVYPGDAEKATKLAQWEAFASKVPVYLYNSDGALQEWCDPSLKDNYSHRHTSHAYSAWPAHEAMGDPALAVGVQRALDMRYSYNASAAESHAHDHRALVEARLGNASGLATPLMWLTKNNYRFNSFMTSHNNSLGSAYCTDLNDSYPGIINESLVYSYDNRIKILPALLSDLNKGSITGLRARCNTLVNALVWDINAKTASITLTTDRDINPIMLGCGVPWKKASINGAEQEIKTDTLGAPYIDLTLSKGNTVTIDFELADTTLSSLKVNGKPLSNFSPVVYNYSMLIPSGMPSTPQVTATANSPSATVAITQASAMSGQATVTVTDGNGKSVYTVNFGYAGSSDEFSGSTLGSQWSWVREDPTKWSLTNNPGFMTITPQTGDLNTTTNTAKNILLQNAFGDWTMESKLVFSIMPHAQYQQGGIIAYQDDNNYLKVDWEYYSANTLRFNVISESGGTVTTPFYVTNPAVNSPYNVWFRMVKSANNYSIYYSLDGNTFALIGSTSVTLSNIRAGLIAYNRTGTSTDLNVMFDYFHLTNTSEQVNSSPTLAALPNYTVDEGKLFALSLSGSDSDTNDALTYSATN